MAGHHHRTPVVPLEAQAEETIERRADDAGRGGVRRGAGSAAGRGRRSRTRTDHERRDRSSPAALPGDDPAALLRRASAAISRGCEASRSRRRLDRFHPRPLPETSAEDACIYGILVGWRPDLTTTPFGC